MASCNSEGQKRDWHAAGFSVCEKDSDEQTCIGLTELGIGTWAWGDEKWGYGREGAEYDDDSLQAAFNKAVELGVTFFDTSEVYGGNHAETVLGWCLRRVQKKCFIATKWHPRANASVFEQHYNDSVVESMRRTLTGSMKRLGVDSVNLFQLHSGSQWYGSLEDYADGLAAMIREGLTKHVGVSNVGAEQVHRIHHRLWQTHGIRLFSNQVEFSLLEPYIITDGTLEACKRLGVKVLAYCPLGMGRLTGKYSAFNEPKFFGHGNKAFRYHGDLPWPHIEKVLSVCKDIAGQNKKSIAQVALNWCIAHGTLPIPGAKTSAQALDNCKTLDWKLAKSDVDKLTAVAMNKDTHHNDDVVSAMSDLKWLQERRLCLILGAMKCGTTALASLLRGHPEVLSAMNTTNGESHFFDDADAFQGGPSSYVWDYFGHAKYDEQRWLLDKTPSYLYMPEVVERLRVFFPHDSAGCRTDGNIRALVCLRNPVARALSHHNHDAWKGRSMGSLPERWRKDLDQMEKGQAANLRDLFQRGLYAKQLRRFKEILGWRVLPALGSSECVLMSGRICEFEDAPMVLPILQERFLEKPFETWRCVCNFLGIDYTWDSESERILSGIVEVHKLAKKIPDLSKDERSELCKLYAADVEELRRMLQDPLLEWAHDFPAMFRSESNISAVKCVI